MRCPAIQNLAFAVFLPLLRITGVCGSNCTLNFLFSIGDHLFNEHVWTDYFRGAVTHGQYRIFLHTIDPENFKSPRHLRAMKVSGKSRSRGNLSAECIDVDFGGMVYTMNRAFALERSLGQHSGAFIHLPGDAIPIKSFAELYSQFCGADGQDQGKSIESSFCIFPTSSWPKSIEENSPIVLHDPWVILTYQDAEKIAEYSKSSGPVDPHSLNTSVGIVCPEYYWYYRTLRGQNIGELNAAASIEQGVCHTFHVDPKHSNSGPFKTNFTLDEKSVIAAGGFLGNVSAQVLMELHLSSHFFFARRFDAAINHVIGTIGETLTLQEAMAKFHLLGLNLHHAKHRRKGDNGGLRVLIVSADDREIKDRLEDNDYVGMTAVLVEDYARHHGYDFLKVVGNSTGLTDRVIAKYNDSLKLSGGIGDTKYGPSCFHPGYKWFRASSWAKVLHVWHVVTQFGQHYDYVWYMDSDAAINPNFRNRSLFDALTSWKADNRSVYWGVQDPFQAQLMFFSNFPWRDDRPCAGIFILKPHDIESTLREWWDYRLESKNRADFMEQDALWYMLEADASLGFKINPTTTSLLNEREFPSAWDGLNSLWLTHIPNYWPGRMTWFKMMLKAIGITKSESYAKAIEHVRKHNYLSVDILEIAEAMERLHSQPWRTQYPREIVGTRADDAWHGVRNWHLRPAAPQPGVVLEGFTMSVIGQRSWWLIENGTRREFPNMATFEKMGYQKEDVLVYRQKDAQASIPFGPPLPNLA